MHELFYVFSFSVFLLFQFSESVGTPKPAPAKVEEPAKPAVPELDETKVVAVIPEPLATTSAPKLPVEKPVAEKPGTFFSFRKEDFFLSKHESFLF